MWTANHYLAWKNRKKLDFNNEVLLVSKYDCCLELYPYLIDDFLIERCQKLCKNDFVVVTDFMMHLKMGKRIHSCKLETDSLADGLNALFKRKVEIPRIKHGKRQTLDTLINEEALLFAEYLRSGTATWRPRMPKISE